MADVFLNKYNKLNQAQKEAVDTIEGPVMVIAGPGTGKTTILTLRIANILKKTDTPPSGILAITFTEAGVKAMRLKLREIIGVRADEVRIHTFHGFAASIIHEFPDHFAHLAHTKQLTDVDAEGFIREILQNTKYAKLRPFGNPDLYLRPILSTIAESKKEAWTPDILRSFVHGEIQRIKHDEESLSTRGASKGKLKAEALKRIEKCEKTALYADVYEAYEAKKKSESVIDFDDLIIEVLLALEKDELLLQLVQEKFLYILVDEHQDTNDSQNKLVRIVANFFENPNLFVVGDEKQAIYRFQGASVENFLSFQKNWPSMKLISLSNNYRSHQGILDAGFSLIEHNYVENEHQTLRIPLRAQTKGKPIEVVEAQTVDASLDYLVSEVKKVLAHSQEKTVAIITRTNRDVEEILDRCESEGISASAERGADIFSHPLGSLYFDLIEFCADPSKMSLLARTVAGGLWNLSLESSVQVINSIKSGKIHDVEKSIPVVTKLLKDITARGSIEYLIYVAEVSGFTAKAMRDPLASEVWRGIVSLAQDIARKDTIIDPRKLIESLIAYRVSAETKTIKIMAGKVDARVSIMTAHGSKGLEYDYVFIPYACNESWMPRARSSYFVLPREKADGDEVRDARRLFYVALTRAREHVTIVLGLTDSVGRELTPLRFISEIAPDSIAYTKVPHTEKGHVSIKPKEKKIHDTFGEYAKHSILERGLSVTALNHFMTCPNQFFFKSIMRVPEPPSPSSDKGNAMHEAMARIWRLKDKTQKSITDTIIDTVREYFVRSLLPVYEKEAIVHELVGAAPLVASALHTHFNVQGTELVETWMERSHEYEEGKVSLACRLHGKLDAVIETDDKVFIFDYKTREAMSIGAIRGETKNDDGGYFRQLVYYKLLASHNPKYKGKIIEPALVFIKPDEKGRCPIISIPITKEDEARVIAEIDSLIASVWSGNVFGHLCTDPACDGCALMRASEI